MKKFLLSLLLVPMLMLASVTVTPALSVPVHAQDVTNAFCDPNGDGDRGDAIDPVACGITSSSGAQSRVGHIITIIVQTLVFIIGGISVIIIVIGGLMYTLSGGDSNNTKRAKDAIQYAIIGLIIALVAQGLVKFVLSRI